MTGFKNFILRGNLVELAVAFIMAAAFAAVVTATVRLIMDLIGKVGGTPNFSSYAPGGVSVGTFLTALISFVILAAVVYFFVVMPYTRAQGEVLPQPDEAGTPEDIELLQEIRDLLAPGSAARSDAGPPHPWWGGTCARSHVVVGVRGGRPRRRVPLVARGLGQHVAEDRGEPPAPLLGRLVSERPRRHAQSPCCLALLGARALAACSADSAPPGELGESGASAAEPVDVVAGADRVAWRLLRERLVVGDLLPELVAPRGRNSTRPGSGGGVLATAR